jgi:hypothetical protein
MFTARNKPLSGRIDAIHEKTGEVGDTPLDKKNEVPITGTTFGKTWGKHPFFGE